MSVATLDTNSKFAIRKVLPTVSRGRYKKHKEDYITRFYTLIRRWRVEIRYVSSLDAMFDNEAFKELVSMGDKAVPLIISELHRQPDLLVAALPLITKADPVSEDSRGDIYAMASAWIEWYSRNR